MSTLTNTQINQTYQGLLKLANSSTGLTSNLQVIEDGLGNSTNMRIATGQLEISNIPSFINLKPTYAGGGFLNTAAQQSAAGTQNIIIAYPFYDKGLYAYSAMTYQVVTATTSTDTVEAAFYTSQMVAGIGLYPHTPVLSGITLDVSPVGQRTTTFGSNISFSGYGAGIYWLVYKISNSNVQPTVRYGASPAVSSLGTSANFIYGPNPTFGGGYGVAPYRLNGAVTMVLSGQTTFDNPFAGTINTTQSTTASINTASPGFIFHTV